MNQEVSSGMKRGNEDEQTEQRRKWPRIEDPNSESARHSNDESELEQLIGLCNNHFMTNFQTLFKNILPSLKRIRQGEHGSIYRSENSIFKIIDIDKGYNGNLQLVIDEVLKLQYLSDLREGKTNRTSAFSNFIACYIVYDHELGTLDENNIQRRFLVIHLEYAGKPLEQVDSLSLAELTAILSQIVLALAVAQNELEFEHRDLNPSHVILYPSRLMQSHVVDREVFDLNAGGYEVTIVGFSQSEVKIKNPEIPEGNWDGILSQTNTKSIIKIFEWMVNRAEPYTQNFLKRLLKKEKINPDQLMKYTDFIDKIKTMSDFYWNLTKKLKKETINTL